MTAEMDKLVSNSGSFAAATLDALSQHIAVLDAGGTIISVNRAWREFAAANSSHPEGLTEGANYFEVCLHAWEDEARRFAEGLRQVISGHLDTFSLEYPCHAPDQRRWYIARVTRFDLEGEVGAVVSHENISARQLAEEALTFRSHLLDTVEQAVIAVDLSGTVIYCNRFVEQLYGWAAHELLGRSINELLPSEDMKERAAEIMTRLSSGRSWSGEFTVRHRDGTTFPAHITDTPIYNDQGTIVGIVGISNSIADRKLAEQRLMQSEEQLRAIFDASRDGILVEQDERVVYVNNSYARLLGYEKPEDLIGTHLSALVSHEDGERLLEYGRRRIRGESPPSAYEFKGRRRDGVLLDLEASVSTHTSAGGTFITTTIRDIAGRKRADEALKESEKKYRLLMEEASDGIHTYDSNGNFIETNSRLCKMLGYSREEMLKLNVQDLVPLEDLTRDPIRFTQLRAGETLLTERRLRRKDGTLLQVEISGRMVRDGVLQSIIRDITERKREEEALRQAYDNLESRVEERTAEIQVANEMLKAEMAERLRAEQARKELLRRLVLAQEEERRRISRELHDQMGQQLTAIMMGLKTLDAASYGRQSIIVCLQQLHDLTNQLAREMHTLAWELRPPVLDELGLNTALYNYVEEWAKRSQVLVDFHSSGFENERLPVTYETTIYRIAQEALTNVVKHSEADQVSVIVELRDDQIVTVIEDNGKGFDVDAWAQTSMMDGKLGLLGMRERAQLLGGTLAIESTRGLGTSVFVRIPVEREGRGHGGSD